MLTNSYVFLRPENTALFLYETKQQHKVLFTANIYISWSDDTDRVDSIVNRRGAANDFWYLKGLLYRYICFLFWNLPPSPSPPISTRILDSYLVILFVTAAVIYCRAIFLVMLSEN